MATVTALEAKTRFGQLLKRVSRGEEIVITRYDSPIARMIPEGRPALVGVRQAAKQLRALRQQMARRRGFRPLTNREIRGAIEEGRA